MEAPWVLSLCNEVEKCTLQWWSGGGYQGETVLLEARGKHVAAIKMQADRGTGGTTVLAVLEACKNHMEP